VSGTSTGRVAVIAALLANLGVAASKFLAWTFTGSSSMLAEGVHSVADSGNQVLLLIGGKRAKQPPTALHPFGYGPFRYLYAFLVALTIFLVGGLFALYEGWHKLHSPTELESPLWAFSVLGVAIVLESVSLRTAVRESKGPRKGQTWLEFIRRTKAPELAVVLLEDLGALLGLGFALIGVALTTITGNGAWDGIATLAIGLLLVSIAIMLGMETRSLLIGESATEEVQARIKAALLAEPGVKRVIHLRTMHLSPDHLLITGKIAINGSDPGAAIARTIDSAERRIRAAVDLTCTIYLEPDIDRGDPSHAG